MQELRSDWKSCSGPYLVDTLQDEVKSQGVFLRVTEALCYVQMVDSSQI